MKILKTLIMIIPSVLILLGLYIDFSTQSISYVCTDKTPLKISNKLFVTIEKYHPWVNYLSDFSGKLKYDIPVKESGSYSYIAQNENTLQLYKNKSSKIQGTYSQLNNNLFLNTINGFFEGKCRLSNEHCTNNILH